MPLASTAFEHLRPFCPYPPGSFLPSPLRLLCLANAAIDGHLRELQPDEAVVSLKANPPESIHNPKLDPLIVPATQGALRAALIGDPFVCAAEDEHLNQLLEDYPLGDA